MSNDVRPNFGLADDQSRRCFNCKNASFNDAKAAYCMLGATGSAPEDGQRVNENFVCDAYAG